MNFIYYIMFFVVFLAAVRRRHYLCGTMMIHKYVLCIGSNADDQVEKTLWGLRRLRQSISGTWNASPCLLNEPVDFPYPAPFANIVASLQADIEADILREHLKAIEKEAGRCSGDKALGHIVLDIDILCIDGCIMRHTDWQRSYVQRLLSVLEA